MKGSAHSRGGNV